MTTHTRGALRLAAIAIACGVALVGCAQADAPAGAPSDSGAPEPVENITGELRIFAAASLGEAFDQLATSMEEQYPQLELVPIVYDGSSTLATQLEEGAPADVFASADENNMERIADFVVDPVIFASNTLVIAVPAGNPGGVETLADLARVTTVLCAPEVPCGAASRTLLDLEGVEVDPASIEQNVTAVLTKVQTGDAEAGLVYATDVAGNTEVESIVPDRAGEVVNRYPIAALKDAQNPEAARAFIELVTGTTGQDTLAALGFGRP